MIAGVFCGLLCAFSHALCYLLTRAFVSGPSRSSRDLLYYSHLWMAAFSLAILPFFWREMRPDWEYLAWPLLGAAGVYFIGQASLFQLLKKVEDSRVSTLL
ncbi:MAG: EamA family transporter, partial [Planctomycetes bacterium]|nr:EamA family transporter [Planctomycetota bacterium]